MGTAGEDPGVVGRQPKGLRDVFQCGSARGYFICVRNVGVNLPHGTGPGKLSAQSLQVDNRDAAKATGGWGLEVTTTG